MSETAKSTTATEEAKTANVEKENLIPKEKLEEVTREKDTSIQNLQKTVEELQGKLLDENYLEYLANKKNIPAKDAKALEVAGVPSTVIQEINNLKNSNAQLQSSLQQVVFHLELAQVEKNHPDFDEYRKDVQKILEKPGCSLTFEEAYKIAKSDRAPEKKSDEKKSPQSTEKPSTRVPAQDGVVKEFKNRAEADQATMESLKSKYGLSGDTL